MLKRIPASDYLTYDRMRRDYSAKVLQRAWRHKGGSPFNFVKKNFAKFPKTSIFEKNVKGLAHSFS